MSNTINCVLLVDDDRVANFLNERIIKGLHITNSIRVCDNGEEGIKFIKKYAEEHNNNCPELILLDLKMPVVDGFEFINAYHQLNFQNKDKVKIIVVTTSTHEQDIEKIIQDESIGYINKPLTEEKLMSVFWKKYGNKE